MRTAPATFGLALLFALAAACASSSKSPVPPRPWDPAALRDPDPAVRAAAAEYCPRPLPTDAAEWLQVLLQDGDERVRVAACHLVRDSGDPTHVARLVTILEDDPEGEVVEAAYKAGIALGQRDACSRGLITRLVPDSTGPLALRLLVGANIDGRTGVYLPPTGAEPPETKWDFLQVTWTAFLDDHMEEMAGGRRLRVGDPEVLAELLGHNAQFPPMYLEGPGQK